MREGARRGLERGLDAHDHDVGVGGTQRGGRDRGGRVAGDHDGLGALCQEALDDAAGELEDLRLVLLAVGGVCGVAEEAEVLVGQLGDERPQNADAAHAGVEHPDEAVSLP